ncbi:MAG: ABC transporter ATP-binding protein [Ardenticatenaceae bacterium]|nr:ABC transporter ATP-binding protein [Ardenticatenaceae bacterium]
MEKVIEVNRLGKLYGDIVAVDDVSFEVQRGEIFGIVGPNGAGKTTTVESLIGLKRPDKGEVQVLGLDPQNDRPALAQRIGTQLQQTQLAERIKVWEVLNLFSSFYDKTVPWEPLLDRWGLSEKRHAFFGKLSGGQKQRLFIALALINDPEIVFLDEITTGLDPQARRETWELVQAIRDEGKTVVMVTHYMDEVEMLCDRVAIIDHGRLIALDAPAALVNQLSDEQRIIFTVDLPINPADLQTIEQVRAVSISGSKIEVQGAGDLLVNLVLRLHEMGITPSNIEIHRPSLEDVFISLTGRSNVENK